MGWISDANALLALIVSVFGVGGAVIGWLYMRGRKDQKSVHLDLETHRRVERVEEQLKGVGGAVDQLGGRVTDVEKRLETVATHKDVGAVADKVSQVNADLAGVAAEVRMVRGMTDTIYRAFMAASSDK